MGGGWMDGSGDHCHCGSQSLVNMVKPDIKSSYCWVYITTLYFFINTIVTQHCYKSLLKMHSNH